MLDIITSPVGECSVLFVDFLLHAPCYPNMSQRGNSSLILESTEETEVMRQNEIKVASCQ